MFVPGYEHETWECPQCHELERRLVFKRSSPGSARDCSLRPLPEGAAWSQPDSPFSRPQQIFCARATTGLVEAPASVPPAAEDECGSSPEPHRGCEVASSGTEEQMPSAAPERSLPLNTSRLQKPGATSTAWQRAVEKLGHRETELKNRIESSGKLTGEPGCCEAATRIPSKPAQRWHNAEPSLVMAPEIVAPELRRSEPEPSASVETPAIAPLAKAHRERPSHISPAALDRFDELWELLGKSGTPSTSTGASNDSGLAPLPRSSSLVVLAARTTPRLEFPDQARAEPEGMPTPVATCIGSASRALPHDPPLRLQERPPGAVAQSSGEPAVTPPDAVASDDVQLRQGSVFPLRPLPRSSATRCMACGAEMMLLKAVPHDTMLVTGFESRTFVCSACQEVEHRLAFTRENPGTGNDAAPAPTRAVENVGKVDEQDRPVSRPSHERIIRLTGLPDASMFARETPPLVAHSAMQKDAGYAIFRRLVAQVWRRKGRL
jgi:hypothetical protein